MKYEDMTVKEMFAAAKEKISSDGKTCFFWMKFRKSKIHVSDRTLCFFQDFLHCLLQNIWSSKDDRENGSIMYKVISKKTYYSY